MKTYLLVLWLGFAALFASCNDVPHSRDRRSETAPPPLPAMSGEEAFADGQLEVEATLSRGFRPRGGRHRGNDGEGEAERSSWRHRYDGSEEEAETERNRAAEARFRMHDSPMPPIVLQLHATNKGTEPLEVTWIECNSILGNFGILPEKMMLAAGQSADTERMTSLLGITGEDVPVTVTLRAHGKLEKKTLIVRATPPPAKPETKS